MLNLTLPPLAVAVAIVLLWRQLVGWVDLALLAALYVVTLAGVTAGFHRHFTHRSFRTHRPIRWWLAATGMMALQGSVIDWVADHRKHHAHSDADGDPHSPHAGGSSLRGLWHAHVGWLFRSQGRAEPERYARDLLADPGLRTLDRAFPLFVALSLAVPFAAGWALTGSLDGGLTGLLWGGLVRIFFVHHAVFSVNSICHTFGSRRFATADRSTNVVWLAPFTLGESWHNNHHAFPRSAAHGLRRREIDPVGLAIHGLARLGLAWDVVSVDAEQQRRAGA